MIDRFSLLHKFLRLSLVKFWQNLPSLRSLFYTPNSSVYLFLPINGAGLGHLTRCLAVAKRLKEFDPSAEIVFITTSIGVSLVYQAGFACYHVPPAALVGNKINSRKWNQLFFRTIEAVFLTHHPATLIFDGSAPYLGLRRIIKNYSGARFIWIKRGLYRESVDHKIIDSYVSWFDTVIVPQELGFEKNNSEIPLHVQKIRNINPVHLLGRDEILPAEIAERILKLPDASIRVYVQLGAGNINGIVDLQTNIVRLLKKKGIQVILARSPISLNSEACMEADSIITDYPNSRYYSLFDFAVLASGYNSVCEAVVLGLPAIFIPNMSTGADDQLRRAQQAEEFGPYVTLPEFDDNSFDEAVKKMLGMLMAEQKNSYCRENGAVKAAVVIAGGR